MATPPIRTIIAQPIVLSGSTPIGSVTDSYSTRTVSIAANTYRVGLVKSTGGVGTELDPKEILKAIKDSLNAASSGANPYSVSLLPSGFVQIVWTGTGTVSITWDAGHVLRNVMGFTSDLAAITIAVAPLQPTHVVYGYGEASDSDWMLTHDDAATETRGSDVYSLQDETAIVSRVIKFDMIPRDAAAVAEFPEHSSASPYLPVRSRLLAPGGAPGTAGPWSWVDFVSSARGKRLAAIFGVFQEVVAGHITTYDAVKLDAATCKTGARASLKVQDWNQFLQLELGFKFQASESLT